MGYRSLGELAANDPELYADQYGASDGTGGPEEYRPDCPEPTAEEMVEMYRHFELAALEPALQRFDGLAQRLHDSGCIDAAAQIRNVLAELRIVR